MRSGKVLTRTIEQEPKQHTFMGVDLGEAVPRGQLMMGLIAYAVWVAIWLPPLLLLGWFNQITVTLVLMPPMVVSMFGWRKAENNPRRRNITQWVMAMRWVKAGHEPVVVLGRHRAHRHAMRLRDRLALRFGDGDLLAIALPGRQDRGTASDRRVRGRGKPQITFRPTVQIVDSTAADKLLSTPARRRVQFKRKAHA